MTTAASEVGQWGTRTAQMAEQLSGSLSAPEQAPSPCTGLDPEETPYLPVVKGVLWGQLLPCHGAALP